jgi:hypothetical protein
MVVAQGQMSAGLIVAVIMAFLTLFLKLLTEKQPIPRWTLNCRRAYSVVTYMHTKMCQHYIAVLYVYVHASPD